MLLVALSSASIAIARRSGPTFAVSDEALIELSTFNALEGHQRLGPYSRYAWHHPGPLLFYALAPFYQASGLRSTGLAAGALTINLAAFGIACWIVVRRGGPALAVSFAVIVAVYLARVADMMVSAWNPHITIIPLIALLVTSAAVACGSLLLMPVAALLASFVVQTHVALLPVAVLTVLTAIGGARRGAARADRARWRRAVNLAAWVLVAVWIVPIADQLAPGGGNLSRLWQFATGPSGGAAFSIAFEAWADALLAIFRRGLAMPTGLLLPHDGARVAGALAIGEVVALPAVAWWAFRNGRHFHMWLAIQLFMVSVTALWAVTRIPDGIHEHDVFWISALGILNAATILGAAAARLDATAAPKPALVTAIVLVSAVAIAVGGFYQLRRLADRTRVTRPEDRRLANAANLVRAEIKRFSMHRALILIDQPVWDAAAGVILQLRKNHIPIAVEPGLDAMFSGTVAADGSEDLEITFCGGPCHERLAARPDNNVVLLGDGLAIDSRPIQR